MKIITTRYGWCCYYEFCVVVLVATCVCVDCVRVYLLLLILTMRHIS
jgi:hypothetical protein